MNKFFSINYTQTHKIFYILGIKFSIKKNRNYPERKFIELIFSVKNSLDRKHKIITVFGFKIKIKKGNKFPRKTKNIIYKQKCKTPMKKLVIMAGFSSDGKIQDRVIYYLKELKKNFDGIIFISDNPIFPSEINKIKDFVIYAKFKRHGEYDFGSYKRGYLYAEKQGFLDNIEEVLLCNDSVYGPLYPLNNVFDKMKNVDCDFWGMVQSSDFKYHLQSWFILFKNSVIKSQKLKEFLLKVEKKNSFWEVVCAYELELTAFLINSEFKCSAFLPLEITGSHIESMEYKSGIKNIMCFPLTLIKENGFPFIKVKAFSVRGNEYNKENSEELLEHVKNTNYELYKIIQKDIIQNNYLTDKYSDVYKLIENSDIVSFDIFDTLLIRPYVKPVDLFRHMEEFYGIPGFYEARVSAEQRARQKMPYPLGNEEVTLDEIYENILPKFSKYKEFELAFEKNVLKRHPLNYKLYEYAKELNKTIIITSDMYLPKEFLLEVLNNNGYDKIDKIYVSCEYNKTKSTGSIFKQIIKDFNIKAKSLDDKIVLSKNILHIGDNEISDGINPKKYGIKTFIIPKYWDEFISLYANRRFENILNNEQNNYIKPEKSVIFAMIAQHQQKNFDNYWREIGYNFGGPLAVGYIQKIIKEVELNKIDSLLFVARDGYILQKVYQILAETPVENNYVYAPRTLDLRCFYPDDFYKKIFINIINKEIPAAKIYENIEDIKNEIEKHKTEIDNWQKNNREDYKKYLKTLNIQGNRIASVDMTTGLFTSSKFLSEFLGDRFLFGFYSGAFERNIKVKYICYFNKLLSYLDVSCINFMELLITSPEPPIMDLQDNKPIYAKENEYDIERTKAIVEIQKGILEFTNDYKEIFNNFPVEITMETLMEIFDIYLNSLTTYDKWKCKEIYHSPDAENKEFIPVFNIKN